MERLLRVTAPHFVAGAIFEKVDHWRWDEKTGWITSREWKCTQAAPILRYLIGELGVDVKQTLRKKGYKWEWVSPSGGPEDKPEGGPEQITLL